VHKQHPTGCGNSHSFLRFLWFDFPIDHGIGVLLASRKRNDISMRQVGYENKQRLAVQEGAVRLQNIFFPSLDSEGESVLHRR